MKRKSDIGIMLKEAAILFAVTLIAGLVLGAVHEITRDRIAEQERLAKEKACRTVFVEASGFVQSDYEYSEMLQNELKENGVNLGEIYLAEDADGNTLGFVIETISSEGYGGNIGLYVGVTMDGTLNGISILDISETPGLGMEAENVLVPQFTDKKVSQFTFTKTGSASDSEIDAISGATITTRAVVNAVNGGLKAAKELSEGGVTHE